MKEQRLADVWSRLFGLQTALFRTQPGADGGSRADHMLLIARGGTGVLAYPLPGVD
jgi:hypothetical protein